MRIWIGITLSAALVLSSGRAQIVHAIPANSTGNQLTLTIANESQNTAARIVEIRSVRQPAGVKLTTDLQTLKVIDAGKEADVTFAFSVDRKVRLNERDTLEFRIADNTGRIWRKRVVVLFTAPDTYALEQNFPNPFNPTTRIYYQLPKESMVELTVYDLLGREIRQLMDGPQTAGFQDVEFDARGLASGVYVYRLSARTLTGGEHFQAVKKLMVLK
jgi:hypothetical protein